MKLLSIALAMIFAGMIFVATPAEAQARNRDNNGCDRNRCGWDWNRCRGDWNRCGNWNKWGNWNKCCRDHNKIRICLKGNFSNYCDNNWDGWNWWR